MPPRDEDRPGALVFRGEVMHTRAEPEVHRFVYPLAMLAVDADAIKELPQRSWLFGYNRFNVTALHDRDYLPGFDGTVGQRLRALLAHYGEANLAGQLAFVQLVTAPRVLGHAFNPVNFFRGYDSCGRLRLLVAEVNNTFGATHVYVLTEAHRLPGRGRFAHYRTDKAFHVSPFNEVAGHYDFHLLEAPRQLDIRVHLSGPQPYFSSRLSGQALPFGSRDLAAAWLLRPGTVMTLPRIVWQAARLHFSRRLPMTGKPIARSEFTLLDSRPSLLQRSCLNLIVRVLARLQAGRLVVDLGRRQLHFGTADATETATIDVHRYDLFTKVARYGDIGFGEAYVDGDWSTDNLPLLLKILSDNAPFLRYRSLWSSRIGRVLNHVRHLFNDGTRSRSRHNIARHYDLSNELFAGFLDETMTYSSARWRSANESLADAQRNKLHDIVRKARIGADDHVLEIGCGWGSFAIEAVRLTGCRVTGITLSRQQRELALQRIAQAGLEDRIDIRLVDYRDMDGEFDRIVSIEMIEAVGHRRLGRFFNACDRLLKPCGLMVMQAITFPDQGYDHYRSNADWIQKHIFPGGICPSISALLHAMTRHSGFVLQHLENFGPDYARTLQVWRERFQAMKAELPALGFDERFFRSWKYYLSYCEAGFAARRLEAVHMTLSRAGNPSLPMIPGYSIRQGAV